MIQRNLQARLLDLARQFPVVTVTGPRQSGKSTLVTSAFPNKPSVSLENLDFRALAKQDPRGFLRQFPEGAVLDEIQKAPELLSYLQGIVDADPVSGRWILTGSSNLELTQGVSQSLAGRSALVSLLPCSGDEVLLFPSPPEDLYSFLWHGGYPAIHDRKMNPSDYLSSYTSLYVERDVRQIINISRLDDFRTFVRVCAGRGASLLNLVGLGSDVGLSHSTARSWLNAMNAGYLTFELKPYSRNVTSRLTKSNKLFFYDTGLMANLLGIEEARQLFSHPLRGALFENWVVSEAVKAFVHVARHPSVSFYRDRRGLEIDLVIERGQNVWLVEAKSSQTALPEFASNLHKLESVLSNALGGLTVRSLVVYGGTQLLESKGVSYVPWREWPVMAAKIVGR